MIENTPSTDGSFCRNPIVFVGSCTESLRQQQKHLLHGTHRVPSQHHSQSSSSPKVWMIDRIKGILKPQLPLGCSIKTRMSGLIVNTMFRNTALELWQEVVQSFYKSTVTTGVSYKMTTHPKTQPPQKRSTRTNPAT